MEKVHRDCSIRLLIGLFINLVMLKPVFETLGIGDSSRSGGISEHLALVGGAIAGVTLVLIARVYWRGLSWQQIGAVLLTPVPALVIFVALRFWLNSYR